MNKMMPTAEELLSLLNITVKHESKIALLRSYARGYVIEALESAAENAKAVSWNDQDGLHQEVDSESILSAYPEEKIV